MENNNSIKGLKSNKLVLQEKNRPITEEKELHVKKNNESSLNSFNKSSHWWCSIKNVVLKKFQAQDCDFIKKETLAQVLSCEF